MGFLDKLSSIADRLHIQSEPYEQPTRGNPPPEGQPGQDPYYRGQDQGYPPPGQTPYTPPNEPQQQEPETYYETSYTGGGGYTSAGVRPRSAPKQKAAGGFLGGLLDRFERMREPGATEPPPQGGYPPEGYPGPGQGQATNVINMNEYSTTAQPGYGAPYGQEAPYGGGQAAQQVDPRYQEYTQSPEPMRQGRQAATTMIYLVRRLQDAEEIIGHMMDGGNVIVNMEEIDEVLKQRVLDMVSGAAFALDCSIQRISFRNYLVAPSGEEISSNVGLREQDPPPGEGGRYYTRNRRN